MNHTRRELSILLPALLAQAQQPKPVLPSKSYEFTELPVTINEKTRNETRQVFDGTTHEGFPIDLHITQLAPGQMPHPPHHHEWEEMIFLQTGKLEINIKGKITHVGPGSVVYVASNEEHGWKNIGDIPSQYFVLATGRGGGA
jgi:mannose-6-phosphate isomerase-like protein (cupin superfamily)